MGVGIVAHDLGLNRIVLDCCLIIRRTKSFRSDYVIRVWRVRP